MTYTPCRYVYEGMRGGGRGGRGEDTTSEAQERTIPEMVSRNGE